MPNPGGGLPSQGQSPRGLDALAKLDDMLLTIVRSLEPSARETLLSHVRTGSHNRNSVSTQLPTRPPPASTIGAASTLAGLRYSMPQSSVPSFRPQSSQIPVSRMVLSTSGVLTPGIGSAPSVSSPAISNPGVKSSGITKSRKHIAVKHYADAVPSMHCHVCCRSAKNVKVHSCARIKEAVCRKVVCVRCFAENGWVYEEGWTCCHCRGVCPKRGQCYTYGRSNMRRRQQTIRKQMDRTVENEQLRKRRFFRPIQIPVQLPLAPAMPRDRHSVLQ